MSRPRKPRKITHYPKIKKVIPLMQMGVREKSKKLINSSTDFKVKLQNMIATSAGVNSPLYRSTKI